MYNMAEYERQVYLHLEVYLLFYPTKSFKRPRRFGKTLNMSMLRYFFEIGTDNTLFDGLHISRNEKLCQDYMGMFPVIFISLKDVDGLDFEEARRRLTEVIGREAERLYFLLDSDQLTEERMFWPMALLFVKSDVKLWLSE